MIEIKISGRGGQGAVLASRILATALFENGMYVQSFPSFGAERRGAPVSAFLRADENEITLRYGVQYPDWMILLDRNLLENPVIMAGASEKTSVLVNGLPRQGGFKVGANDRFFAVDASEIAAEMNLKTTSFSIVNTAMIGAFAKASGLIDLESVCEAIRELVPVKKEQNLAAAKVAYENVKEVVE